MHKILTPRRIYQAFYESISIDGKPLKRNISIRSTARHIFRTGLLLLSCVQIISCEGDRTDQHSDTFGLRDAQAKTKAEPQPRVVSTLSPPQVRNFISGRSFRTLGDEQALIREKFEEDGRWHGEFRSIATVNQRGRWVVKSKNDGSVSICINNIVVNFETDIRIPPTCRNVIYINGQEIRLSDFEPTGRHYSSVKI